MQLQLTRFRIAIMNTERPSSSVFALWEADPDKKYDLTGNIELTADDVAQIAAHKGGCKLTITGFRNKSDKPNAPILKGYVKLPQPKQPPQPALQPNDDWDF
jgi:D-alanyl-D-alanine dipeptidase